jgi:hypothetical protein
MLAHETEEQGDPSYSSSPELKRDLHILSGTRDCGKHHLHSTKIVT